MLLSAKCSRCGQRFSIEDLVEDPNESILCLDCAKTIYKECSICGTCIPSDERIRDETVPMIDGTIICEKCFDEFGFFCPDCGNNYYNRTGWHGVGVDNEDIVCESCFKNYERCELCGEYWTDVIQGSNEGGYPLDICGDCREFNSHVYRCTECGDYFFDPLDDMHNICWKCSPTEEDDE